MKANRQISLPLEQPAVAVKVARRGFDLAPARGRSGEGRRFLPTTEETRRKARIIGDGLRERLGYDVIIIVTDNRSSLVSARWVEDKERYVFRLHYMFMDADSKTIDALSDFGSGSRRKTAGRTLDEFITRNKALIRKDPGAGPRAPAAPRGRHHDLQAIFDELNALYFACKVVARIGWGESRGHGKRRRSIKMGSYIHDARLIRIHPALDRAEVPDYYVAWVVFHEMLHQVVPPVRRKGRTIFHPPEFRRLELAYPDAAQAQAWEDRNFDVLLRG